MILKIEVARLKVTKKKHLSFYDVKISYLYKAVKI